MSGISQLMIYAITVSKVTGALDKLTSGYTRPGQNLDRCLSFMGSTTVPITGTIVTMPLSGGVLAPLVTALYQWFGAEHAGRYNTGLRQSRPGHGCKKIIQPVRWQE